MKSVFIVALFLAVAFVSFHAVQADDEPDAVPSEDLCRPYIEKALKDLGTGSLEQTSTEVDDEAEVDSQENEPQLSSKEASEQTSDSTEVGIEVDVEDTISTKDQIEEDVATEDETIEKNEAVPESIEAANQEEFEGQNFEDAEGDTQDEDKLGEENFDKQTESTEEPDEVKDESEEGIVNESKEGDVTFEEEVTEDEEAASNREEEDVTLQEDEGAASQEDVVLQEEEDAVSQEEKGTASQEEEDAASQEEIALEDNEDAASQEEGNSTSQEGEDTASQEEENAVSQEEEDAASQEKDNVVSEEESAASQEEEVTELQEEAGKASKEMEEYTHVTDESEQDQTVEEDSEEAETEEVKEEKDARSNDRGIEDIEEENIKESEEENGKSEEEEKESAETADSRTMDESVRVEGEVKSRTKRDSEDEEEAKSAEGKDDTEIEESKEAQNDDEPTPEEDLIQEIDIPENLRPRDHINQLLKLDEENESKERAIQNAADIVLRDLKRVYDNAIQPLESLYKYRDLSNRHFGDPEIFSKPLVLFMGPWSGGKSSIINYLLNIEYTPVALRTGAEPSPAYFNILMYGEEEEILDGTQLAADWTFSGLQKFGQGMLDRLRGVKLNNKLLEKVNIVEIPGILEIRKQVQRLFPFNDACQWFIDRADIIFLVYDPSKLDVGPETEAILDQLKGREYQTRIILNKADQVKPEELMRVQGALIWNISPLMSSAEPPIMYSTSLWSLPYEAGAPTRLLYAQERAFLRDLRSAIDKRVEHKIASARRFAVRVRNHAKMVDCYLTTYYNHKTFFGNKKEISDRIIENPQDYHIYEGLSTLTNISRYDLPDPDVYRDFFRLNSLYEFQLLSSTCTYFRGCPINRLDVAIAYDLPDLVGKYKKSVEAVIHETEANSPQS